MGLVLLWLGTEFLEFPRFTDQLLNGWQLLRGLICCHSSLRGELRGQLPPNSRQSLFVYIGLSRIPLQCGPWASRMLRAWHGLGDMLPAQHFNGLRLIRDPPSPSASGFSGPMFRYFSPQPHYVVLPWIISWLLCQVGRLYGCKGLAAVYSLLVHVVQHEPEHLLSIASVEGFVPVVRPF